MSVHQLKDGRWVCAYPNPAPPPRYRWEYFGRGMEAEARARDRDREVKLQKVRRSDPEEPTFFQLFQGYLAAKTARMEASTVDRITVKFDRVILPRLASVKAHELTPEKIDAYVNHRLARGTLQKGKDGTTRRIRVTRTTVHGEVTYIQAILNWAVERKIIRTNPLAGYTKPKRDDAIVQPVTAAEAAAILRNTSPHVVRAIALSYYTGLRPGRKELLSLKWSAVDWDQKTILIVSAKKGGIRFRTVPLHPRFLPLLKRWHKEDGKKKDGYLITYRGERVDKINKAFASAKRKAGITRKLPPYAFRHAFVTNLLAAGADLKSVSEMAGHTRIDTTTGMYQHTAMTLHRDSVGRLPALKAPK